MWEIKSLNFLELFCCGPLGQVEDKIFHVAHRGNSLVVPSLGSITFIKCLERAPLFFKKTFNQVFINVGWVLNFAPNTTWYHNGYMYIH